MTIELKCLRFFAYHGLYAEERMTGNEFEVNLSVSYIPVSGTITHLGDTVNYAVLYELLKTEMQTSRDLLETLVMEITERIHLKFPQVNEMNIEITKLHPPILKFTGTVGVKYSRKY